MVVSHVDGHKQKLRRGSEPALIASDMSALKNLAGINIDFLSLGHTQSTADIQFSRKILASLGRENVKVIPPRFCLNVCAPIVNRITQSKTW